MAELACVLFALESCWEIAEDNKICGINSNCCVSWKPFFVICTSGSALWNTLPKIIVLFASIRSALKTYPFSSMILIDVCVCVCECIVYFVIVDINNSKVL